MCVCVVVCFRFFPEFFFHISHVINEFLFFIHSIESLIITLLFCLCAINNKWFYFLQKPFPILFVTKHALVTISINNRISMCCRAFVIPLFVHLSHLFVVLFMCTFVKFYNCSNRQMDFSLSHQSNTTDDWELVYIFHKYHIISKRTPWIWHGLMNLAHSIYIYINVDKHIHTPSQTGSHDL